MVILGWYLCIESRHIYAGEKVNLRTFLKFCNFDNSCTSRRKNTINKNAL
jgi:hypothetical protein